MGLEEIQEIFKALADETRLRLLKLLANSDREICVCELDDSLKLPQYTVSKHLNVLKRAGFLDSRRQGTWIYYSISEDMYPLAQKIVEHIGEFLQEEIFEQDRKRLEERLAQREEGKCVIGYSIGERETNG